MAPAGARRVCGEEPGAGLSGSRISRTTDAERDERRGTGRERQNAPGGARRPRENRQPPQTGTRPPQQQRRHEQGEYARHGEHPGVATRGAVLARCVSDNVRRVVARYGSQCVVVTVRMRGAHCRGEEMPPGCRRVQRVHGEKSDDDSRGDADDQKQRARYRFPASHTTCQRDQRHATSRLHGTTPRELTAPPAIPHTDLSALAGPAMNHKKITAKPSLPLPHRYRVLAR